MKFIVKEEIFRAFPGMRIITVVAKGIGASSDETAVERVLLEGWENAAKAATAHGNPQSHPNIIPWVERMKAMGAPRKKFPSSIEAMVRRASKGGQPFRISSVVDFYNGISMKNIVPAGGFDLDQLKSDLLLRLSLEGDTFVALDSQEETPVPPGEVSYADGPKIITRHFVWKQAKHALLTEESNHILFVSEILGEIPDAVLSSVRDDLIEGLRECFGITAECRIVDENNPCIDITV